MHHNVIIQWGLEEPKEVQHRFSTKAELDAFMMGVAEAMEWGAHAVIYDSREDPNFHANSVKMVCRHCRSEEVVKDAFAEWSRDDQEWILHSVYDSANCNSETCDGNETRLEEEPLHSNGTA